MSRDLSSNKFERQERLSVWNQRIIKESTVLIVGLGGTGGEVAKNLALLGIGKLILIDLDTIEFSNLNRQLLFTENDIGKFKAEIAKKHILERYNPDINIEIYTTSIQDLSFEIYKKIDVIAGCVDNFLTRQYLNEIAIEANIPLIDSATDGYFGQIQRILSKQTACLACDSPVPPDETRVLAEPCTIVGIPRVKEHCAWKALYKYHSVHERAPDDSSVRDIQELTDIANEFAQEYGFGQFKRKEIANLVLFHVPSLITVNAVTSGIQSQEIIKSLFLKNLTDFNENDQKYVKSLIDSYRFRIPDLTVYSALTGTTNSFDLSRDPKCLVCRDDSIFHKTPIVIEVNPNSKCDTILKILKDRYNKYYIGFRGEIVLNQSELISNTLQNGDRIIASSLEDNEEIRIEIKYLRKG